MIIKANKKDVSKFADNDPKIDRLLLNEGRIKNITKAIRQISKLPNPSGKLLEKKNLTEWVGIKKDLRAFRSGWCHLRIETKRDL